MGSRCCGHYSRSDRMRSIATEQTHWCFSSFRRKRPKSVSECGSVVAPNSDISLTDIAKVWYLKPQDLPSDVDPSGLEVTVGYKPEVDTGTFSYAARAAVAYVDTETGHIEILDYVVVEDGGVLQLTLQTPWRMAGIRVGIGTAYEEMIYDERADNRWRRRQPITYSLAQLRRSTPAYCWKPFAILVSDKKALAREWSEALPRGYWQCSQRCYQQI